MAGALALCAVRRAPCGERAEYLALHAVRECAEYPAPYAVRECAEYLAPYAVR